MIKFDFIKKNYFKSFLGSLSFVNKKNIDEIQNFYLKNNKSILSDNGKNILIKGDVQSGKTNNIIYLISEYAKTEKYFIYLSGHLNNLNEQNMDRIKKSLKYFEDYHFKTENMNKKSLNDFYFDRHNSPNTKFLFFGIKRKNNLKNIIDSIQIHNKNAKIIIIDDEADSHTLSKEWISYKESLLNGYNLKKYISITATPYFNLYNMQKKYDSFYVYKSHARYVGLEDFFSEKRYINTEDDEEKIYFNMILNLAKKKFGTLIWNVSRIKKEHINHFDKLDIFNNDLIRKLLRNEIDNAIFQKRNISKTEFKKILLEIKKNIYISNSDYVPEENKIKIVIGRENMSRGITYEDLIAEYIYYKSSSNYYNPAVIMQASRWFGAREIGDLFIFMNKELFLAYKECLVLEKMVNNFDLKQNFRELFNSLKLKYLKITKT